MTTPPPRLKYSLVDYVRFEHDAYEHHEFVGGLIVAMAGGTLEHSALSAQVVTLLPLELTDSGVAYSTPTLACAFPLPETPAIRMPVWSVALSKSIPTIPLDGCAASQAPPSPPQRPQYAIPEYGHLS